MKVIKVKKKNSMKKRNEKKNEESKLKIHKGLLGFNGGYPSQKPIKGDSSRGRKLQRKTSNHGNLLTKGLKWNKKYCLEESRSSNVVDF